MPTTIPPLVRQYFEEHPGEDVKPGTLTRWVEEQRGFANGDQSAGAVRAALNRACEEGWLERVLNPSGTPVTPLRYRYVGEGMSRRSSSTPSPKDGTPPPPPRKSVEKFTRPSGEPYFPRQIGDFRDIDVLRTACDSGLFVLMYGPPGAGKTALVEAAYHEMGLITMAGDADTGVPDFTGDFVRIPEDRNDDDAWADGPLVKAMQANDGEGCVFFIDDATLIPPGVMSVIYPAMDGRRRISVKSRPPSLGRDIVAGPKFYIVAAHNPGVPGAILSEALSSRFTIQIEVTTDYDLARSQGVNPKAVNVAANMETTRRNGKISWAPQMRELIAFRESERKFDTTFACAALIAQAPDGEDRDFIKEAIAMAFASRVEPLSLGTQV